MYIKNFFIVLVMSLFFSQAAHSQTTISSLQEFIDLQDKSNQDIKMVPGTYHISSSSKSLFKGGDWRADVEGDWPGLLHFTGNNNKFDLTGVTITFDSTILNEMPNMAHANLVELSGNNNEWTGFNLQELPGSKGDYGYYIHTSGGTILNITGSGHAFNDLTVKSRYSHPYGFGSIYGKTGSSTGSLPDSRLGKKSGLLLHKLTDSYLNNVLVDHSAFGHTLFLSGPIDNVVIENATIQAETRSTNDLRKNGIAGTDRNGVPFGLRYNNALLFGALDNGDFFDLFNTNNLDRCQSLDSGFQTGPIREDFQFSLVEGAFRGYSQDSIENLVIRNATVIGARSGIALEVAGKGLEVENMTVREIAGHGVPACNGAWNSDNGGEGDATAYGVPSHAVVKAAKADAAYSTVTEISGDRTNIFADIEILDPENGYLRPSGSTALALISGDDHEIRLWKRDGAALEKDLVIKVGSQDTSDLLLCNMTQQDVTLSNNVKNSTIYSIGNVIDSSNGSNTIISVGNLNSEPAACTALRTTSIDSSGPEQPDGSVVHITKRNASGFAIDGGVNGENGQNVHLWPQDANNVNQQWIEIHRGNNFYSYQKQGTNLCIDGNSGGEQRQNVHLWNCNGANQNQHWEKVDAGSGYFQLVKRNSRGFALDGGKSGSKLQNIKLYDSSSRSQNLHWSITPQ